MPGGITNIIKAILNKPLFGTGLWLNAPAVDPSIFPEDEYPVHCPKCLYPLRGLPDGNCPECGEPFTRGRLLVFEYVEGGWFNKWWKSRPARWCLRLVCIGWAVAVLGTFAYVAMLMVQARRAPSSAAFDKMREMMQLNPSGVLAWFAAACVLAAVILVVCSLPRNRRKRRRAILKACEASGNDSRDNAVQP